MDFGRVIRNARRARGLNQKQLAERMGSTQRQISLWETGKRSPQVADLERIAAALQRELTITMEPIKPKRPSRAGLAAFDELLGKRSGSGRAARGERRRASLPGETQHQV